MKPIWVAVHLHKWLWAPYEFSERQRGVFSTIELDRAMNFMKLDGGGNEAREACSSVTQMKTRWKGIHLITAQLKVFASIEAHTIWSGLFPLLQ